MHHLIKLAVGTTLVLIGLIGTLGAIAQEEKGFKVEIRNQHEIDIDCEDGEDCNRHVFIHKVGNGSDLHGWSAEIGSGAFLGVELTALTPELRNHFGVPESVGVMVSKVLPDSPAEAAGVEVGDIVTAVDDTEVSSTSALAHAIRTHEDGDAVVLEVWREGGLLHRTATLAKREVAGQWVFAYKAKCDEGVEDCNSDIHQLLQAHGINWQADFDRAEGIDMHHRRVRALSFAHDLDAEAFDCDGGNCTIVIEQVDGQVQCTINGEVEDCPESVTLNHD